MLPVTYHHLVFTLPHDLDGWVEVHPEEIYDLLFETVWATLSAFGADPKRLDGQLGMTAMLHTWGQSLVRHVHLHCLVPGGALSTGGDWHPAKSTYLFPVRALSRHFRGGFVSRLRRACEGGALPRVRDQAEVERVLKALMATEWVVYSKPALARTETVVDYLGRYSHRIALSDSRLLDFDGESVALAYTDYRDGDRRKVMTLSRGGADPPLPPACAAQGLHAGASLRLPGQPLPSAASGADPHRPGRAADRGKPGARNDSALRRLSLSHLPHWPAAGACTPAPASPVAGPRGDPTGHAPLNTRGWVAATHRPPAACGCARPARRKASTLAFTSPPRNPC